MGRSPGFASTSIDFVALFRLGFPMASARKALTLPMKVSRRIIMQKARRHPGIATIGLRPLVGMWFQVQYPPLTGVLPIFRSRYSFTIGRQLVFSLGRWTSRIQTRFHVTGFTRGLTRSRFRFAYGTVTRCGCSFHSILLPNRFVTPYWWPHNPAQPKLHGLGSFLFARRYWGNRIFSLLSYGYLDVSVHRVSPVHLFDWVYGNSGISGSTPV